MCTAPQNVIALRFLKYDMSFLKVPPSAMQEHVKSLNKPWPCHGIAISWHCHGIAMALSWPFHGIATCVLNIGSTQRQHIDVGALQHMDVGALQAHGCWRSTHND